MLHRIRQGLMAQDETPEFVLPGSKLYTSTTQAGRVYVDGEVHSQTVEGFWGTSRPTCVAPTTRSRRAGFPAI